MKAFVTTAIVCLAFLSCDRKECKNVNPIFDRYTPSSQEYKAELAKQLTMIDKSSLKYWVAGYEETATDTFMNVYVQNGDLCAVMQMRLAPDHRLNQFKKVKGVSYHGAGLSGLVYDISNRAGETGFVYRDMKDIID